MAIRAVDPEKYVGWRVFQWFVLRSWIEYSLKQGNFQVIELPHVKSNPKIAMPQDRNRTIRKANITGITIKCRGTYGVKFERQAKIDKGNREKIPAISKEGKIQDTGYIYRTDRIRAEICDSHSSQ